MPLNTGHFVLSKLFDEGSGVVIFLRKLSVTLCPAQSYFNFCFSCKSTNILGVNVVKSI